MANPSPGPTGTAGEPSERESCKCGHDTPTTPEIDAAIEGYYKAAYDYGYFREYPQDKPGWRYCSFREHFAAAATLRKTILTALRAAAAGAAPADLQVALCALRNVLLLAIQRRRKGFKDGDADHLIRFCREAGVEPTILRAAPASPAVREAAAIEHIVALAQKHLYYPGREVQGWAEFRAALAAEGEQP